jgi:anti-sigma factor ChrR (cupin superfamily)
MGESAGVRFATFLMDEEDATSPLVAIAEFAPGETVEPHTHATNYFEYVLEGEQAVGKKLFRAGDIRFVKASVGYGPIIAGPHGCTVLVVLQDAAKSAPVMLGRAKAV